MMRDPRPRARPRALHQKRSLSSDGCSENHACDRRGAIFVSQSATPRPQLSHCRQLIDYATINILLDVPSPRLPGNAGQSKKFPTQTSAHRAIWQPSRIGLRERLKYCDECKRPGVVSLRSALDGRTWRWLIRHGNQVPQGDRSLCRQAYGLNPRYCF